MTYRIAPSILSADFARLGEEVDNVLKSGADIVHFDVMDNHYVPNLTIGPLVCEALRKHGVTAPIDVHLMVKPVDRIIPDFAKAGATYITFHPEASEHIDRTHRPDPRIRLQAGLVFNPATPLDVLEWTLDKLDMVLLMSVNPGFGGQKFIPHVLDKARKVRRMIEERGLDVSLEIDGGVGPANIREVAQAGVDTFVAGSAVFGAGKDRRPATATTPSSPPCARSWRRPDAQREKRNLSVKALRPHRPRRHAARHRSRPRRRGQRHARRAGAADFAGRHHPRLRRQGHSQPGRPLPRLIRANRTRRMRESAGGVQAPLRRRQWPPHPHLSRRAGRPAAMRAAGLKTACVTNKAAAFTGPLLEATGLAALLDMTVSGDTLAEKKPHPLPFLHICERFGITPRRGAGRRRFAQRCRRRARGRLPGVLRALRLQRGRGRARSRRRCYSGHPRRGGHAASRNSSL
jgi:ribulose-phosphate 3-epimerase